MSHARNERESIISFDVSTAIPYLSYHFTQIAPLNLHKIKKSFAVFKAQWKTLD